MSIPLDLFSDQAQAQGLNAKIWMPFQEHMSQLLHDQLKAGGGDLEDFDTALKKKVLAEWGAETDWFDPESPLYFKDQESLVQFVLAWSK